MSMKDMTVVKGRRRSATLLDREMEAYAYKLLKENRLSLEDRAKYEQVLAARRRKLLKLRSARGLGYRTLGKVS
jgi:hypothetical protein